MEAVDLIKPIESTANSIMDYGFLIIVAAVFIVFIIIIFISNNKRYTKMFDQLLAQRLDQTDLKKDLSKLVSQITEVLTIVKENNEGITEQAMQYQTYTGSIKIVKSYINSTKLEIIRQAMKIVEKNNISNVKNVEDKVSNLLKVIRKKRCLDLSEYKYQNIRLSEVVTVNDEELAELIKRYIFDRERTIDRFIGDIDTFFADVLNNAEERFMGQNERN